MEDWDSILNPYEESLQKGSAEGRESGLKAGFEDGHHLGKVKALEIGVELGYMHSIASSALAQLSNDNDDLSQSDQQQLEESAIVTSLNSNDRIMARLKEFIAMIQDFPSPDVLFSANHELNSTENFHDHHQDSEHQFTKAVSDDEDLEVSSKIDVVQKMQRIRAKFKTILVQMKIPHLTLKKVMNGGAVTVPHSLTDNNAQNGNKVVSGTDGATNDNEW